MSSKKTLALLLAVVMVFALFSACGGEETTTAATTGTTAATTEGTTGGTSTVEAERNENGEFVVKLPLSNDVVEFSTWVAVPAAFSGAGIDDLNGSIAFQEMEERTNVHVNWTHPAIGQEVAQFNLMIASQLYPDVINAAPTYWIGGVDKYVDDDIIIELDPYLEYMQNWMRVRTASADHLRQTLSDKGRICFWQTINQYLQPTFAGPLIRGDWADELGIDMENINTYDEWDEMFATFKNSGLGQLENVFDIATNDGSTQYLMDGYNISEEFAAIDGEVVYGPYSDNFKKYIGMLADWYQKGYMDKDFYTRTSADRESNALNGRVAVVTGGLYINCDRWDMQTLDAEDPNWYPIQIPLETKDTVRRIGAASSGYQPVKFNYSTISTMCSEELIPIICQWHDYLQTEEGGLLRSYGIEGETFYFDDEGQPRFMEIVTRNPDGISQNQMQVKSTMTHGTVAGLYDWRRELDPASSEKQNEITLEVWSKNLDYSQNPSISVAEEYYTEYSRIYNDVQTYVDEWVVKAITGSIDWEAEYDNYRAELERLGVQDMIRYRQEALDGYYNRDITFGYTEEQLEEYGINEMLAE